MIIDTEQTNSAELGDSIFRFLLAIKTYIATIKFPTFHYNFVNKWTEFIFWC